METSLLHVGSEDGERQTVASVLQHRGYLEFQCCTDKLDTSDIKGTSATPLFRYLDRKASSSLDTSEIPNSNPKPLYPQKERVPSSLKTMAMRRPYSAVGTMTVTPCSAPLLLHLLLRVSMSVTLYFMPGAGFS